MIIRLESWQLQTTCMMLFCLFYVGCTEPIYAKRTNDELSEPPINESTDGSLPNHYDSSLDVSEPLPINPEQEGEEHILSDASGSPASISESTCSDEGVLRCAASASTAREICHQGIWKNAKDCNDDQICDTSNTEEPGTCVAVTALCLGSTNEFICVDGTMHECNADAISITQQTCQSQLHCQTGLPKGQCAVCIPDQDFQCKDNILQRCADDGMEFITHQSCNDAQPCNAEAGACTAHFCLTNSAKCNSDQLLVCNDDQSAFELSQTCESSICDAINAQCDICVAGIDRKCTDEGKPAVCNATGQGWDIGSCNANEPICVGQGRCVECASESDCSTSLDCHKGICSQNSCMTQIDSDAVGTACGFGDNGVCNGLGQCVGCRDDSDCGSQAPYCSSTNQCVECELPLHCENNSVCKVSNFDMTLNRCVQCVVREDCTNPSDPLSWRCQNNRCVYQPYCGNGILDKDTGEQCDDGSPTQPTNWASWDGCGTDCQINTTWGCEVENADRYVMDFATQWIWTIPDNGVGDHVRVGDLATCAVPCAKAEWGWNVGTGNSFMYDTCPVDGTIPGTKGYNSDNPNREAVVGCINGACLIKCGGALGNVCPAGYICKTPEVTNMDVYFESNGETEVTTTDFTFCMADDFFEE